MTDLPRREWIRTLFSTRQVVCVACWQRRQTLEHCDLCMELCSQWPKEITEEDCQQFLQRLDRLEEWNGNKVIWLAARRDSPTA